MGLPIRHVAEVRASPAHRTEFVPLVIPVAGAVLASGDRLYREADVLLMCLQHDSEIARPKVSRIDPALEILAYREPHDASLRHISERARERYARPRTAEVRAALPAWELFGAEWYPKRCPWYRRAWHAVQSSWRRAVSAPLADWRDILVWKVLDGLGTWSWRLGRFGRQWGKAWASELFNADDSEHWQDARVLQLRKAFRRAQQARRHRGL